MAKKVFGADRINRILARIPEQAKKRMQDDVALIGRELNVDQRAYVPVEDGVLKSTIRSEPIGGNRIGVFVKAGGAATRKPVRVGQSATYDYAFAQEFGTKEMAPTPFFYPIYRAQRTKIKRRLTASIKKAIKGSGWGSGSK